MRGILVIDGGDAYSRQVFTREGRGLWSRAMAAVLEKHGLLEADFEGPEALTDPVVFQRYACVLVCRLPEGAWTDEAAARALAAPGLVVVEAPLPGPIRSALRIEGGPISVSGRIDRASPQLKDLAIDALGVDPGGAVAEPESRVQRLEPERDWRALGSVPIDAATADAWRKAGWEAEAWSCSEGEVLATWAGSAGEETPAVVRSGGVAACSWGIFSHLGQQHTSEPTQGEEFRASPRTIGLEAILLALIRLGHQRARIEQLRVLPWPDPFTWAFAIRHDVDRRLGTSDAKRLLEAHRDAGTAATWYWLAWHLRLPSGKAPVRMPRAGGRSEDRSDDESASVIRLTADAPGHEVALHTALPWTEGKIEQRLLEETTGRAVAGSSAHGDPNCFRYQGAPNVLWAAQQGFAYTELVQHSHLHPHRFAALSNRGQVEILDQLVCLPRHESFERSTEPGDTIDAEDLLRRADLFRRTNGFLQILNHPDLNYAELFAAIDSMPIPGRLDWNAAQAADWWLRTHSRNSVSISRNGRGVELETAKEALGVTVELVRPDGTRRTFEP